MEYRWVELTVEHVESGITGVHYVEVSSTLVRPEAWAKNREQERLDGLKPGTYRVLGGHLRGLDYGRG